MTDDSSVHEQNEHETNIDPLTAPFWPVTEGEAAMLEPDAASEPSSAISPEWVNTTAPQPPSVDQILRGEYTGWVPIIKAGENLRDAETRAEEKLDRIEAVIEFEETLTTDEIELVELRELPSEILEPLVVTPPISVDAPIRKSTAWTDLVEDPDTAKSPADALEEARARIQVMRESLQYNIRRVSESFEHPIFNDQVIPDPVDDAQTIEMPHAVPEAAEEISDIIPEELAVSVTPVNPAPVVDETVKTPTPTIVIEAPAHEYVTSAPIGEAVAETKAPDTSLELMIMRDEIKDLRTRLDASQKLIEDLMHRLTNLTELALKSRQN